jgi:hypothetical protein
MKKDKCYWMHCLLAIIGFIFCIFAVLGTYFIHNFLSVNNPIFFLHAGNSFFLMSIASKVLCKCNCCCKDEKPDQEKK